MGCTVSFLESSKKLYIRKKPRRTGLWVREGCSNSLRLPFWTPGADEGQQSAEAQDQRGTYT